MQPFDGRFCKDQIKWMKLGTSILKVSVLWCSLKDLKRHTKLEGFNRNIKFSIFLYTQFKSNRAFYFSIHFVP